MKGAENSFAAIEDLTDENCRRSMKNAAAAEMNRQQISSIRQTGKSRGPTHICTIINQNSKW